MVPKRDAGNSLTTSQVDRGALEPIILTSRADPGQARIAARALAMPAATSRPN